MNQKQREFLIDQVNKNYKRESEGLKRPVAPSLNNYITAAILDGSFKIKDAEAIRKVIHDRVLKLGKKSSLLGNMSRSRWDDDDDDGDEVIELKAKDFFEIPAGYVIEWERYEREKRAYEKTAKDMLAMRDTLLLKIQIGSDKVLDRLIEEADNLADLSLMQTSLILKEAPKQLGK